MEVFVAHLLAVCFGTTFRSHSGFALRAPRIPKHARHVPIQGITPYVHQRPKSLDVLVANVTTMSQRVIVVDGNHPLLVGGSWDLLPEVAVRASLSDQSIMRGGRWLAAL